MLFFKDEEDSKKFHESNITSAKEMIIIYESSVKGYKESVKSSKEALKRHKNILKEMIALNASDPEWALNIVKKFIKDTEEMIKTQGETLIGQKKELKRQRERLTELQADYRQRYSAADAKKNLTLVECSSKPFKKSNSIIGEQKLSTIKGGLYKSPVVVEDDILSDEFKAWRKAQQAVPEHHDNA
jgi:hypothetical protein